MQTIKGLMAEKHRGATIVTTGNKILNTTVTIVEEKNGSISTIGNRYYDVDKLFDELSDLVNWEFKRWYCKQFYRIGVKRVLELASVARHDGKYPAKLFSKLLKEH